MSDLRVNYETYPNQSNRGGVERYLEFGVPPGGFLTAVICNNLKEAVGRADDTNQALLVDIIGWWYNEAPAASWGSREHMDRWIVSRRERCDKQD